MIALLRDFGVLSEERIELLLSWRNSGFSVHNAVRVAAGDTAGIERLGRYLLRSPVAVERLELEPSTGEALYHPKDAYDRESVVEHFEPTEFLARLLQHVPAPRLHQLRYFGRYSSVVRARRAASEAEETSVASAPDDSGAHGAAAQVEPDTAERRRLRRLWASMIRRVYEVDPLICRECGGEIGTRRRA